MRKCSSLAMPQQSTSNQGNYRPRLLFGDLASTSGPGPYGPGPLNLKEFSNTNMLQDHIWNAHCSRSMFTICSWSSMLFKYGPGAYLTYRIEYSSRLLMVQDHVVLDISRGQNLKKAPRFRELQAKICRKRYEVCMPYETAQSLEMLTVW